MEKRLGGVELVHRDLRAFLLRGGQRPHGVGGEPCVAAPRIWPPAVPAVALLVGFNLGDGIAYDGPQVLRERDAVVLRQRAESDQRDQPARELLGAPIGVLEELLYAVVEAHEGARRQAHVEPTDVGSHGAQLTELLGGRAGRVSVEGDRLGRERDLHVAGEGDGVVFFPRGRVEGEGSLARRGRAHRPANLDVSVRRKLDGLLGVADDVDPLGVDRDLHLRGPHPLGRHDHAGFDGVPRAEEPGEVRPRHEWPAHSHAGFAGAEAVVFRGGHCHETVGGERVGELEVHVNVATLVGDERRLEVRRRTEVGAEPAASSPFVPFVRANVPCMEKDVRQVGSRLERRHVVRTLGDERRERIGRAVRGEGEHSFVDRVEGHFPFHRFPCVVAHGDVGVHLVGRAEVLLRRLHLDLQPAALGVHHEAHAPGAVRRCAHVGAVGRRLLRSSANDVDGDESVGAKVAGDRHRERGHRAREMHALFAVDPGALHGDESVRLGEEGFFTRTRATSPGSYAALSGTSSSSGRSLKRQPTSPSPIA